MKLKKIFLVIFVFLTSLFSVDDFKRFLNDNMGGLILPFGDEVYFDEEWMEYKRLEIDESNQLILKTCQMISVMRLAGWLMNSTGKL